MCQTATAQGPGYLDLVCGMEKKKKSNDNGRMGVSCSSEGSATRAFAPYRLGLLITASLCYSRGKFHSASIAIRTRWANRASPSLSLSSRGKEAQPRRGTAVV